MSIEKQIAKEVTQELIPLLQEMIQSSGFIVSMSEEEVLRELKINKSTLAGLIASEQINPIGNGKRQRNRLFNRAEIMDRKRSWGK